MIRYVTAAMLVVAGIIHLLPLPGLLGSERLASLYGVAVPDANLAILLQHRAVLFGLLGTFLILAAFRSSLQLLALVAGAVSVVSFLWLAWSADSYNASLARVVLVDLVALGALAVGAVTCAVSRRARSP